MRRGFQLLSFLLLLSIWSIAGRAQPATAENTDDLFSLADTVFENGTLRLTFRRADKTGSLRALVAYDPSHSATFEDFDEVPVDLKGKEIAISFPKPNQFGLSRIEAQIVEKKFLYFGRLQ